MFDNSLKDKPERLKSLNKNYNLEQKLIKEEKINKDFLHKLSFLTIEDLLALKLSVSARALKGKLFNFPILKFISDISKEACLKFALSSTQSKKDASMVLGITKLELNRLIKLYNIRLEGDKHESN